MCAERSIPAMLRAMAYPAMYESNDSSVSQWRHFAMALLGAKNFMVNYGNFLALLLCVMAPWTAINLVDFYLVQRGTYEVPSFFVADGGIYGRYNATALFCYGLGILVQVPFLAAHPYTGWIAKALGGVDISWLVALAVVGPLYYAFAHRSGRARLATGKGALG
jgi:NCS1 family nucleobase:cation symporter-1